MQIYEKRLISRFLDAKNTIPIGENSIYEILSEVKQGIYKKEVEFLRTKKTKEERDALKGKLIAWTISGEFVETREKKNFCGHTQVISIDIDRKDNEGRDLTDEIAQFQGDPSVLGYYRSASGDGECKKTKTPLGGYALFFAIEVRKGHEAEDHKRHYFTLKEELEALNLKIDPAPKELNAIRFASYDPDAYIKEDRENVVQRTIASLDEKASTLSEFTPRLSPPQRKEEATSEAPDRKFTPPPPP